MKQRLQGLTAGLLIATLIFGAITMVYTTNNRTLATDERAEGAMQFGGRNWLVLEVRDGYALLLHETVIAEQPYHDTREAVTWEASSSRAWLNGEFLDGFSEADRARIRETAVINNVNPWWRTDGGNDTTDRIFLLSAEEVVRYLGDSGMLVGRANERDWNSTPPSSGLYISGIQDFFNASRKAYNDSGSAHGWWLRTPGDNPFAVARIASDGTLALDGGSATLARYGLRPALWLNLDGMPVPDVYTVQMPPPVPESPANVWETIRFGGRNWFVLDERDGHALLLHETVITNRRYHDEQEDVTWAESSSRAWLNGEFLNGFSAADRARIRETTLITGDNPWTWTYPTGAVYGNTPGGANTTDSVFLLSLEEVVRYFGGSDLIELGRNESNRDGSNDGLEWLRLEYHAFDVSMRAYDEAGSTAAMWWLRSPGYRPGFAGIVGMRGSMDVRGDSVSGGAAYYGLRPALWLNLEETPAVDPTTDTRARETTRFGGRDWLVLDERDGHVLLLHETVITDQPYHRIFEDVTWAESSSREWLNDEFLTGFSAADRARIRETTLINNDNPWTWSYEDGTVTENTPGGASTTDRVFLLSMDEVVRYFGDSGMFASGENENNRDSSSEDWHAGGIYRWGFHDQFSEARIARDDEGSASWWWLRSPGESPRYTAIVNNDGNLYICGYNVVQSSACGGLRPALWLNLEETPVIDPTPTPPPETETDA